MFEFEFAAILNGVGDAQKEMGQILHRVVLRKIECGLEVPDWVSIGQGFAAGGMPPVLGVIKRTVEVIGLLGILENALRRAGDMVNST